VPLPPVALPPVAVPPDEEPPVAEPPVVEEPALAPEPPEPPVSSSVLVVTTHAEATNALTTPKAATNRQ
jgi:hypothetical protein